MAITVVKLDPQGAVKTRYQGEIIEQTKQRLILQAQWIWPVKDLGYVCLEPGDRFVEYYFTNRWFNIFDIASANGKRKGWYCNVAEPVRIFDDHLEQVDLILDIWVTPSGKISILEMNLPLLQSSVLISVAKLRKVWKL